MATKFITVITDESMQKICYESGSWMLTPDSFAVSETDVLNGLPIIDDQGEVTEAALNKLCEITTKNMMDDINRSNVWCQLPFSSVIKESKDTLNHHIVIPPDLDVTSNKSIKTIYFRYKSETGEVFLYAVGYAIDTDSGVTGITYEIGVTQSFYFTFTVANEVSIDGVDFKIDYVYPQDIDDHNVAENVHDNLVKRDCSRTITGDFLKYDGTRSFVNADPTTLITKKYVDDLIATLKTNNNLI